MGVILYIQERPYGDRIRASPFPALPLRALSRFDMRLTKVRHRPGRRVLLLHDWFLRRVILFYLATELPALELV